MIRKILNVIRHPWKILMRLDEKRIITLPDKKYLTWRALNTGFKFDLDNPQTFNEKLNWLKLHDKNPLYTKLVDKYEVKDYISSVIGKEYVIPTIGIYNKFDEIDISKLPKQFVIKCTHDSASVVICKDKNNFDFDTCKAKINKALKKNYYYGGREWPYKNVKPRILIEKYMVDESGVELKDYKFFCFQGKMKFFKIDFDRFTNHGANYYNRNREILTIGEVICPPNYNKKIVFPKTLDKMIDLAEKLSSNIPFVRIDFYNINGKIYFGEMTFYPASGYGLFIDSSWDKKIGDLIDIRKVNNNEK